MATINGTKFNDNNSSQYNGTDFQFFSFLNGTGEADTISGLAGDDVINGNGGDDSIAGGAGNDLISGNAGVDSISGGVGNDKLLGGAGNDNLIGNDGDDILAGGVGNDTLFGGAGNDRYLFDTTVDFGAVDKINGFNSADDTIWLDDAIFTKLDPGALNPDNLVKGSDPVAADANDFLLYNNSTGTLSYDADGNGAGEAVEFATLTGVPSISAFDFVTV